jgi:hypothetical protein
MLMWRDSWRGPCSTRPIAWTIFWLPPASWGQRLTSKGNAAYQRAFPITTAKTIGPRVCDPTTFNP